MRLGMLARSDHRGLGIQSVEFFRNMHPRQTVVVDMGELTPYENHPEDFPGAPMVRFVPGAPTPGPVIAMLERCDVVWSAETLYWDDLAEQARRRNCRTAVTGNYEFLRWNGDPGLGRPDVLLAPSTWHLPDWPEGTVHLPFPVARDRLPFRARTEARTFLLVGGHRAMRDRAGLRLALAAARFVTAEVTIRITSQSPLASYRNLRRVEVVTGDRDEYWRLYDGADVLLAPRRYGGQSFPVNEAMSAGMPVVALDREPERSTLPRESLIPARRARTIQTQGGEVGWWDASPRDLAAKIDELAGDPALVEQLSKESDARAAAIGWEALRPRFLDALAGVTRNPARATQPA